MYLTNFGKRNRIKLVPRQCDAQFQSCGPPTTNEAPPPPGDGPRAELICVCVCVCVRVGLVMGFNLSGYTFLCDHGFRSYGQIKF